MSDAASIAKHFNGSATTTAAPVDVGTGVAAIVIENMDATNNLLVSFDGGTTFKTVKPGIILTVDVSTRNLVVKSSAGTVNYEILVTVR